MTTRVRLVVLGALALVVVGLGAFLLRPDGTDPSAERAAPAPSASRATTPATVPPTSATPTPTSTPTPSRTPTSTPTRSTAPRTEAPTASPKPSRRPARTTPPPVETSTSEARQVLALTNAERADAGCEPLAWDGRLATAAARHSSDMAAHDYFAHTSRDGRSFSDRVTAAGYGWSRVAENIAAGQGSPEAVVASWMGSEGHRRNILDCRLTELGVGVARSAATGNRPHWTQDFGTPG